MLYRPAESFREKPRVCVSAAGQAEEDARGLFPCNVHAHTHHSAQHVISATDRPALCIPKVVVLLVTVWGRGVCFAH